MPLSPRGDLLIALFHPLVTLAPASLLADGLRAWSLKENPPQPRLPAGSWPDSDSECTARWRLALPSTRRLGRDSWPHVELRALIHGLPWCPLHCRTSTVETARIGG